MTLRRTGDWPRKKPLRSSKPLVPGAPVRSAPLARRSSVSGVASGLVVGRQPLKPSRPKVTAEERNARKVLAARSEGRCEGCQREPATDWAHRVARSQGGPWVASNGLHLGRGCHGWAHANPVRARELGWILRSTDNPRAVPAFLAGRGFHLLADDGEITPTEGAAA